ncbi:hypothetical protein D3C87_76620 [compost metagenome]
MSKYDVVLNIKLDQELKSSIENLAEELDITSSSLVRSILKQHFKKVNNLNEKQSYYYDHLLQEIINHQEQIEDIEFQSSFGKHPTTKVVKVKEQEYTKLFQNIRSHKIQQTIEDHILHEKISTNEFNRPTMGDGLEVGDMKDAELILSKIRAEKKLEKRGVKSYDNLKNKKDE